MVIPFIIYSKWLYTVTDRMVGKFFEVRGPMRIDRPIQITKSTHPFEKHLARFPFFSFSGPVNHHHAGTFVHQLVKFVQMGIQQVASMACTEDDDRRRPLQDGLVFWITVIGNHNGVNRQSRAVECFG